MQIRNRQNLAVSVLLAGSVLLSAIHSANAAPDFREFRSNNPHLARHAARQQFHTENIASRSLVRTERRADSAIIRSLQTSRDHAAHANRSGENRVARSFQFTIDSARLVPLNNGINLDLSSNESNIVLGTRLFGNVESVTVTVGGQTKTLHAGEAVTAAEYVAAKQVLTAHAQLLILAENGSASGGSVDLGDLTSGNQVMRASNLLVPQGVTAVGDFARGSDFRLLGDLSNSGTVEVYSSGNNARSGAIRAVNLSNNSGALISSQTNLTLDASNNFNNSGTIISSGSLEIIAGTKITNSSNIVAHGDLRLTGPSVANSGNISSSAADVTFSSPGHLDINNTNGIISAAREINIRDQNFGSAFNSNIYGGDLVSQSLNLNSGGGVANVDVNELSGLVNSTGFESHVAASTDNLNIGGICLSGDPTFKNDAGNININGNVTVNEAIAIIASGNVTDTTGANIFTGGSQLTILAGAAQIAGGTNSSTAPGTASGTTLTGNASATGGMVSMNSNINTRNGNSKKGAGGNVLIGAFAGTGTNAGQVNLDGSSINTGGRSKRDNNGGVTILAGAGSTGVDITVGEIETDGGNATTGDIKILTATPRSSDGNNVVFDQFGKVTSGNSIASSFVTTASDISLKGSIISAHDVSIQSSGAISFAGGVQVVSTHDLNLVVAKTISGTGSPILNAGNNANLEAGLGIASTVNPVDLTAGGALTANSGAGSIFINSSDELNVASVTAAQTVRLLSGGDLTVSGNVESANANVQIVVGNIGGGQGGNLTIGKGATVTGSTGVILQNDAVGKADKVSFLEGSVVTNHTNDIEIGLGGPSAVAAFAPKNSTLFGSIHFSGTTARGSKPINSFVGGFLGGGSINVTNSGKSKMTFKGATIQIQ